MATSKALLITILSLAFVGKNHLPDFLTKDCDSFKVVHTISEKNNGYSLDLTISGGKAPYKIILSKETGDLVTEDFSINHFDSLAPGKYVCVVIDNQNCRKKLEITVP